MFRKEEKMRKTSIDLNDEQYFFLKEKAMAHQKQGKSPTIISIIRDLIEADRKKWKKEKS
jgi:hypothetical protein